MGSCAGRVRADRWSVAAATRAQGFGLQMTPFGADPRLGEFIKQSVHLISDDVAETAVAHLCCQGRARVRAAKP